MKPNADTIYLCDLRGRPEVVAAVGGAVVAAAWVALLRAAIARSGLTTSAYARDVLIRDPRTVRRWLAGDSPIPQSVLDYLTATAPRTP